MLPCCVRRPSIDSEVFFPARSPLGSSRVEPEKLRIESGQQLFDVRDLADRGLFAGRGQFLRRMNSERSKPVTSGSIVTSAGCTPMALRL